MDALTSLKNQNYQFLQNGEIILSGHRNLTDRLWDVPLKQKRIHKINYIISRDKNKAELAQYSHGYAFSSVTSTFHGCIRKGNFI